MKPNIYTLLFFKIIFLSSFLISCKRDKPDVLNNTVVVNDGTRVTGSVSGFVLNESNVPIQGATVTSGVASATTDMYGSFMLENISLSEQNGSVTVSKPGYFTGVRSFKTSAGKDHFVKIELMEKQLSGTLNAATGGTINSNGGTTITFPANAFVDAAGAAYNGTVNVFTRWIDPTSGNLPFIIPGDLRGVNTAGVENMLVTFGMVGAEIEDASGNVLKIAAGKTASIAAPIPSAILNNAPATIPLWHFDNATARWKEEGVANKSGNTYTAQVNKFSFWNFDQGFTSLVSLDYTLLNGVNNTPLVGTSTRLKILSSGSYGYGITNNQGFVKGLVPLNEPMMLEVMSNLCPTPVFSIPVGPFTTNTSLGNISVTLSPTLYYNFTGTVQNCSAAAVTNGYISLYGAGGNSAFAHTDAQGNFSFSILNCAGTTLPYSYMGVDNSTSQQSVVTSGIAATPVINLGTVRACSTTPTLNVYISGYEPTASSASNVAKVWKNGTATNLTNGVNNGQAYSVFVTPSNDVYVTGIDQNMTTNFSVARVWKNGNVLYTLTDGTGVAQANGIVVSGTDVYVTGSVVGVAKVWKNGVATTLTSTGTSHGNAIAVIGSDVYVAGIDNSVGKLWKNGTALFSASAGLNTSNFKSLYVDGTDVYAVGVQYNGSRNVAKFWKNGVATLLDNGTTSSSADGIFISGSDVYVTGNVTNVGNFYTKAILWKNGVATELTNGLRYGAAKAVTLIGNDVYVLGNEQNTSGNQVIVVWKNGLPENITDGTESAISTSFFIK